MADPAAHKNSQPTDDGDVPRWVVVMAALTAFVLHFGTYFGGISPYLQGTVRNPAVASTFGILGALGVGLLGYVLSKKKGATFSHIN